MWKKPESHIHKHNKALFVLGHPRMQWSMWTRRWKDIVTGESDTMLKKLRLWAQGAGGPEQCGTASASPLRGSCWAGQLLEHSSSNCQGLTSKGFVLTGRREEKYLERFSCELSKSSLTNGKQTKKVTKLKITCIFKKGTDSSRVNTNVEKSTFVFLP